MSIIKEFNYSNTSQRKLLYYNLFLSFSVVSFIFTDSIFALQTYFFYLNISKIIFLIAISSLFIGSLFGKTIFSLFTLFQKNQLYPIFSISTIFFLFGIKTSYLLKISCGHFIDEKFAVKKITLSILFAIPIGILLKMSSFFGYHDLPSLIIIISFSFFLLPSIFLLKLEFNSNSLQSKEFLDENQTIEEKNHFRDDLLFTYLNFSFLLIYIYICYETISKYFIQIPQLKLIYLASISIMLVLGLLLGFSVKKAFWHIYSEMLFPLFTISFIIILYLFHGELDIFYTLLTLAPTIILFGFSLHHTITNIDDNFNQIKKFNILFISIFILPVPIIFLLSSIPFTNLIFFIFLYFLAFLNLLIPGIHLANRKIDMYKKLIYFLITLIFIPSVFFVHIFFNISLENNLFLNHTKNYDVLRNINYNSNIIKEKTSVLLNGKVIFKVSDSRIKDLKRAIMPLALYANNGPKLFIDGNQKFFRNPVYSHFNNFKVLDVISDKLIDFKKLPISGNQKYITEKENLLFFLLNKNKNYSAIMDIPNLLDQKINHFRKSNEYYSIIKNKLSKDGIYIQLFNLNEDNRDFIKDSILNLENHFKYKQSFLFSQLLVVLNSNKENIFKLNFNKLNSLRKIITEQNNNDSLFLDEYHLLAHNIHLNSKNVNSIFAEENSRSELSKQYINEYLKNNSLILNNQKEKSSFYFKTIKNIKKQSKIYTLLKKIENSEAHENYLEETEYFFKVIKYTENRYKLRKYLKNILEKKKNFYLEKAINYEKNKNWKNAIKLYQAILIIDKKNFDANYRLGILNLTLQDMDKAYSYLKSAMKLRKNNPNVLFQMGILSLSLNNNSKAIELFQKVLQQKKYTSELYHYIGIAHEKNKNLKQAQNYYKKALFIDSNDIDIKNSIERVSKKIDFEKNRWQKKARKNQLDAEIDEEIPLPINKSAIEIRLENEKQKNRRE